MDCIQVKLDLAATAPVRRILTSCISPPSVKNKLHTSARVFENKHLASNSRKSICRGHFVITTWPFATFVSLNQDPSKSNVLALLASLGHIRLRVLYWCIISFECYRSQCLGSRIQPLHLKAVLETEKNIYTHRRLIHVHLWDLYDRSVRSTH